MLRALNFRRLAAAAVAAVAAGFIVLAAPAARAGVVVTVDKSAQRLTVSVNGMRRYDWPVSTARWGYRTPNGVYRPQRLERQWYSRKYDWSPMPHSIFFNGGYAIHGSYEISRLGTPASHGCIRLHPQNAATLFALVKANARNTEIVVSGSGQQSAPLVSSRKRPRASVTASRAPATVSRMKTRKVYSGRSFEEIFVDEPYTYVPAYTGSIRSRRDWR